MKIVKSIEELVSHIPKNASVYVHGGCATPDSILKEMPRYADKLGKLELIHLHLHGSGTHADFFKTTNLFVGSNMRKRIDYLENDYLPCFLSEIPSLFRKGKKKINVALIQVSHPDTHGFCSLGTSVDVSKAAIEAADFVLAQINSHVPRTHGDGLINISDIDYALELNVPLLEGHSCEIGPVEEKIGHYVGQIIEDGSTLQLGIGAVPDAVCRALHNHKDLGLHSEMWSMEAMKLIKSGVINNRFKKIHKGKSVSAFVIGNTELFDFINDNPSVVLLEADYVNYPINIARNPKVVAINSAVEIDLTGQVCADSVGHRIISGVGGQMDFMRGAALSENGKPIIAMTSRSKNGNPRFVASLTQGAGVVTTRAHMHYVATEFGIVDLFGKTLHERAKLLISIAHPEDRETLERQWFVDHKIRSV